MQVGAYLPGAYEEVVEVVEAFVLTDKTSLHVKALRTHKDQFGTLRRNGEEWLVRIDAAETYIPDVYEEVVDQARGFVPARRVGHAAVVTRALARAHSVVTSRRGRSR